MKKALIITDSYNWATYFRALNLKKNLRGFEMSIVSFHDIGKYKFDSFDVVYISNWPIYGYVKNKIKARRRYKLVTGVSSHIGRPSASDMGKFFRIFDLVGLSNKILLEEFSDANLKNILYTPFGVNTDIFKSRTSPSKHRRIFGWVGNKSRDVKRFRDVQGVFKKLGKEYKLKVVTQSSGYSRAEMSDFYNSIGTLICFSSSEGTPNPVLEGAMCGRAIISTNVGNVPELMHGIKSFSPVVTRNDLLEQVKRNADNKHLGEVGREVLRRAQSRWSWRVRAKRFEKLLG
jgi:glycosyltransferase involved in cell wall biosynthesis